MNPLLLPLAERYERFRDALFSGVSEGTVLPGLEPSLSELDQQSLWYSGAFGHEFTTTDGQSVRIEDFGTWNAGAGPDFTGCTIRLGDTIRVGDIELDPDARDWERHRHGANPEYDRVVLHVFLEAPTDLRFFTRNRLHQEVPQVRLSRDQLAADAQPKTREAAARLGRCGEPLREMPEASVVSLIESAAQHRLRLKSLRLHRLVAAQGREQALFQALAQTLGYRHNQRPFAILSQRLPLKRLLKEDPLNREALLLGVAGFLEDLAPDRTQEATRSYLGKLWARWWKLRDDCQRWLDPRHTPRWKMTALRPGNHPQRRLGALSALIENWPVVSTPLMDATRWSLPAWSETIARLQHDFWSTHYTLTAQPAAKPLALIGDTRVHEMLANVVYPLLVPERTRLWAEYLELPALLDNQKVRRAALRLFGRSERARQFDRKLFHHQGLLQIYEDFCLEDRGACADCPFPERLKEWT